MLDEKDLQAIAQLIQQSASSLRDEMREQNSSLRAEMQEQNTSLKAEISNLDKKMGKMQEDIDTLKEDVADIKENAEITRNGVNTILEWADDPSKQEYPLFGKKAN